MENPSHFLSIDPGEASTGWATFSPNGVLTGLGIVKGGLKGFVNWLEECETTPGFMPSFADFPETVICETYRIKDFVHKHNMSTVPTIRVIGYLEGWAHRCRAEWVEQESTVYPTGLRWAGHKIPKGHVPDQMSALGHGVYHLQKRGLWEIKL